jgi:type IV pilus assembly protein PilW
MLPSASKHSGFSLIEIMVGMAIGLIGIVIIFQVMAMSEARKRTTGSGTDAQIAGSIAMFNLERDVRLAGYGFGTSTYLGCSVYAYDSTRGGAPNFSFGLYPVQIVDGASGAPDTINVLYGNSSAFVSSQDFISSTATSKKTKGGRTGLQRGDLVIVAGNSPAQCAMVEVAGDSNPDALTIDHTSSAYISAYPSSPGVYPTVTPRYNPVAGPAVPTAFSSGAIYNLGPSPQLNTWQIQNRRTLAWSDGLHSPGSWSEVAEGVINLQAQYGLATDTTGDGQCDSDDSPNLAWGVAAPTAWSCLRAIRVGLLARSQQYEKDAVTNTAPSWAAGAFTMTNIDGSADSSPGDANDWRHYRYHVYQTVIPLRNMIWGTTL